MGHISIMNMDWKFLLTALGLVFVLEGMPYFLFAEGMPQVLKTMANLPPKVLRGLGGGAMLAGLILIWLVKS